MRDLIYLDNSATSFPKPQEVYDFMNQFYQSHGVNPGRSGYDMCIATEEIIFDTRKKLTSFFNGTDPNRLTFSYNASSSLNNIIQGLLEKGDHVITSNLEHNSVIRTLYHFEHEGKIEVTRIPFDENGYIHPEDIQREIKKSTKLVVLNHGSNVVGTVQPIGEIGKVCVDAGIIFAVDVSQTAGIIPIDIQTMYINALAFTGHKCLMGPTGIGGSYCSENLPIKATRFGGTGVRSAHRFHLEEFPYRLECGTLNIIGVAGLHAGQKWLEKEGIDQIHNREMSLWEKLTQGLQAIEGITTYCSASSENHIAGR